MILPILPNVKKNCVIFSFCGCHLSFYLHNAAFPGRRLPEKQNMKPVTEMQQREFRGFVCSRSKLISVYLVAIKIKIDILSVYKVIINIFLHCVPTLSKNSKY